jgi:polyisoprenyl-phosphate glycosyltransferase
MARASVAGGRISLATLHSTRLARWCASADGIFGSILLLFAFAFHVFWSPRFLQFDEFAYAWWGDRITHHFFDFYSFDPAAINVWNAPAYPPVANYLFGLITFLYVVGSHLVGHAHASHILEQSPALNLALKLPSILANLIVTAIIYVTALRRLARPWALFVAALFAFAPVMFLDVEIWGQTDAIVGMAIVVAVLLALRQQSAWSGVALALIVNFKPQPAVFVPLVLVYLLRWGGWRPAARAVAAFVGTTLLVWLPYLLPPRFDILAWRSNVALAAGGLPASHDAANLWPLLGHPTAGSSSPLYGPLTPTEIGSGLFIVAVAITAFVTWRDRSAGRLWAGAALTAQASYYFLPLQYQRYLIPAIGLLLLAALFERRYWLPFAIVSITTFINLTQEFFLCHCETHNYWATLAPLQALVNHVDLRIMAALNGIALLLTVGIYLWGRAAPAPAAGANEAESPDVATLLGNGAEHMGQARQASQTPAGVQRGAGGRVLRPRRLNRPPFISVVIPCYNEEGNIQAMYDRLTPVLGGLTPTYEIIFVNNGSYDGSADLLDELAARDARVSVLTLSRNFGSQGAYSAGFAYASGDCVVGLDGDIQDPPEMIADFVAKWLEGYDVVYGVRARRKGSLLRRIGYKVFYRVLRRISYVQIPVDASDFALMDRRVIHILNGMPERSRLIRGLRAYAGFSQTGIPYVRQERFAGRTTNSFLGLFRWAGLGIVSFSFAPLDLISYLAITVVGITALALVVYTALYFIVPGAPRGFQTLLVITLFLGSVQLLCLSIIGTYLGKIFEEVKARPNFLVHDIQNDHRTSAAPTATALPTRQPPDPAPETLAVPPRAPITSEAPRTSAPS